MSKAISYNAVDDTDMSIVYTAEPTPARFHCSDKIFRLIMGPVGCLSCDTEVMTPNGWVRIDQWQGQSILEWNPDGKAEFRVPSDYIVAPCQEFISFSNQNSLSMVLSPEHRVPLYDWKGEFKVVSAERIEAHPSDQTIPTMFSRDHDTLCMTDAQIRLWVAIAADGCYPKAGKQCVITVRKERKKERIRGLLAENGIAFTERYSPGRPTEGRFTFTRPDHPKHFDSRFWMASSRELRVVLDEADHWDGLHNHVEKRFCTCMKDQADLMQFAAHACGVRATIGKEIHKKAHWKPTYYVQVAHAGRNKNVTRLRSDSATIRRVPSVDGKKYCFTTSTGYFVARHNGRIFCTGNSGKSSACVIETFLRARAQNAWKGVRSSRCLVVRSTFPELELTTIKTFLKWFPEKDLWHRGYSLKMNWSKPFTATLRIMLPDKTIMNAEYVFLALDRPDDAEKLKSFEASWAYVNEIRQIEQSVFKVIQERTARYPSVDEGGLNWSGVFADSNPFDVSHWLYQLFLIDKPPEYELFRQPPALLEIKNAEGRVTGYVPNVGQGPFPPAENVRWQNKKERYWLDLSIGATRDYINCELMGNFGSAASGKVVYTEFRTEDHVAEKELEPMRGLPMAIGFDYGLSPAACFAQITPRGQLVFLDELVCGLSEKEIKSRTDKTRYHGDTGIRNFANNILKPYLSNRYGGMEIIYTGDPAGGQRSPTDESTVIEELARCGINVSQARTNIFIARKEAVEGFMMKRDGMKVSPRCSMLIEGFQKQYKYRMVKKPDGEGYTTEPEKNIWSHIHDAAQYVTLYLEDGGRGVGSVIGGGGRPQRRDVAPSSYRSYI